MTLDLFCIAWFRCPLQAECGKVHNAFWILSDHFPIFGREPSWFALKLRNWQRKLREKIESERRRMPVLQYFHGKTVKNSEPNSLGQNTKTNELCRSSLQQVMQPLWARASCPGCGRGMTQWQTNCKERHASQIPLAPTGRGPRSMSPCDTTGRGQGYLRGVPFFAVRLPLCHASAASRTGSSRSQGLLHLPDWASAKRIGFWFAGGWPRSKTATDVGLTSFAVFGFEASHFLALGCHQVMG